MKGIMDYTELFEILGERRMSRIEVIARQHGKTAKEIIMEMLENLWLESFG